MILFFITRLIADKINKIERKNKVTIEMLVQDMEPPIWWDMLGSNPDEIPIHVSSLALNVKHYSQNNRACQRCNYLLMYWKFQMRL